MTTPASPTPKTCPTKGPADTCPGFLTQAVAWFTACNITVERVPTDSVWSYSKKHLSSDRRELGVSPH
ncbi:hypothetical protein OJ963_40945 [Streptomyces sp. RS2]|nr:hypothetical protein [Streptomyces sp. RS2]MCW1100150.1 hypothetical protein [Streptomyces sp. RS2]